MNKSIPRFPPDGINRYRVLTLDLSPSRAGQHIGQCVSSNHLCPPLRRVHLPTSVPVFSGLRGWAPANFSSVFLFPFFARSPVQHLFGFSIHVHSGHMTQPRQSFPSDDAAQLLLSCSFSDYLVWNFIPPCDMQYPPQPSMMRRLQSPAVCCCDWPCLGSV